MSRRRQDFTRHHQEQREQHDPTKRIPGRQGNRGGFRRRRHGFVGGGVKQHHQGDERPPPGVGHHLALDRNLGEFRGGTKARETGGKDSEHEERQQRTLDGALTGQEKLQAVTRAGGRPEHRGHLRMVGVQSKQIGCP